MRSAIIPELQWGEEEGETGDLHVTSRAGPRLSLVQGMEASREDGRGGWILRNTTQPSLAAAKAERAARGLVLETVPEEDGDRNPGFAGGHRGGQGSTATQRVT